MPEVAVADLLPATAVWSRLAELKSTWGVSMAALLYRARTLKIMRESIYRNAMSVMSAHDRRRHEPGPSWALEHPTMLTKAVELVGVSGTDRDLLAERAGVTRADLDLLAPSRQPSPIA